MAGFCLCLLGAGLLKWGYSCHRVVQEEKYWAKRRLRSTGIAAVLGALEVSWSSQEHGLLANYRALETPERTLHMLRWCMQLCAVAASLPTSLWSDLAGFEHTLHAAQYVTLILWLSSAARGLNGCQLSNTFCPWSEFSQWSLWNVVSCLAGGPAAFCINSLTAVQPVQPWVVP